MRRQAWPRAVITGLLLVGFVVWRPADHPRFRLCGFHFLTGYDCPLCGLTRGLCAAAKGEWRHAVALHPLSLLVLIWLLGAFLIAVAALAGRDCNLFPKLRLRLLLALPLLLIIIWPLRLGH